MKLIANQKLWIVPKSYSRNSFSEPKEATIDKVGNKYFTLKEHPRDKFNIENLREENNGNYKGQCYLTLQEILDEREISKLTSDIRLFFYNHNWKLSIDELRQVDCIIKKATTPDNVCTKDK